MDIPKTFFWSQPVGTRRHKEIVATSFQRFDVVSTFIQRCFNVVYRLGGKIGNNFHIRLAFSLIMKANPKNNKKNKKNKNTPS